MAVHLTASQKGKITFTANMTSPHENVLINSEGLEATLLGVSGKHEGLKGKVRFMGRLAVRPQAARSASSNGILSVVGADEATIFLAVGTNVKSYKDITGDEANSPSSGCSEAMAIGYQALKARTHRPIRNTTTA